MVLISFLHRLVIEGLLVSITVILFIQVISRYLFNTPLVWTEEVARYLFVWVSFMGIGYGVMNSCHIRITFLVRRLSREAIFWINSTIDFLVILSIIYLSPVIYELVVDQQYVLSSAAQVPMIYVFAAMPVGFTGYIILSIHAFKEKSLDSRG